MAHTQSKGKGFDVTYGVDLDLLAEYLESKMKTRELSLRRAAIEMGFSPATLSRLLEGNKNTTMPDTINLGKAANWLGRNLSDFEYDKRPKDTTLEEVEVHLRALEGVSKETAAMMVAAVRSLYVMDDQESSGRSS